MQRRGRSAATLFIDIKEAFYCVIRQHSLPATFEDEDVFRFLNRMGVCDMHIDQVARLLAEGPSLEALGCDEHLLDIVTEFHRTTWFHLASDVQGPLVHTEKGTRPGDGFADVLWALTFSKWLIRLENHLAAEEVLSVIPWNDENNLMTSPGHSMITKGIVAWADDVAVMTDADEPLQVVDKLSYLTEVLVQDLQDFGMTPNFGHGKTEAVLDLRGRSSHAVRRKIFNENKGQIPINTTLHNVTSLRIVHKYKHLGGSITHGCKLQPELQHRIAQGRKTCLDYKQKIYGNKAIPLGHRLQVLRATALTSTLYNSGTWSRMNAKETQRWVHGVISLYRIALQRTIHHLDLRHMTDLAVLGMCQALHPLTDLRIHRLRSYGQYLSRHCKLLWALLAEEQDWRQMVIEDFQWLYNNIQGMTIHPSPTHDLDHWNHLIVTQPGRWKDILRRVSTHTALQLRIHADVATMHRTAINMLHDKGVDPNQQVETNLAFTYKCFICDVEFDSYTGWAIHAFKKHGRTQPGRQLQEGTTCLACAKQFTTPARLARHFRTVPRCAETVAAQGFEVPLQPGFGSATEAKFEEETAMQMWTWSKTTTFPPSSTWATTPHARRLLQLCRNDEWTSESEAAEGILRFLKQEPISHDELLTIIQHLDNDNDSPYKHITCEALHAIALTARIQGDTGYIVPNDIDPNIFMQYTMKVPEKLNRMPTAFRYILHVFSGVRRKGDLHGALLQYQPPDGTVLFPISIDIVLSGEHCDLLDPKQQKRWLNWAREGATFMAIGGPPCETWSVSQLRWNDNFEGPRPLRDGSRLLDYIWALPQLRIREARQIRVANALLQFCILLFLAQVLTGGIAIMEHPDEPAPRGMLVPPSIWNLPLMQFIKSASTVFPLHIKQGYWNALSPKPTLLLVTVPDSHGSDLLKCLEGFRVRADLPPPLKMGKATKSTFNTAALKHYPPALCAGMENIPTNYAVKVPFVSTSHDEILPLASLLRAVYTNSTTTDDGHDFAGDRN